jgi:hypothetical protein
MRELCRNLLKPYFFFAAGFSSFFAGFLAGTSFTSGFYYKSQFVFKICEWLVPLTSA